jgi:hypothetical protein
MRESHPGERNPRRPIVRCAKIVAGAPLFGPDLKAMEQGGAWGARVIQRRARFAPETEAYSVASNYSPDRCCSVCPPGKIAQGG